MYEASSVHQAQIQPSDRQRTAKRSRSNSPRSPPRTALDGRARRDTVAGPRKQYVKTTSTGALEQAFEASSTPFSWALEKTRPNSPPTWERGIGMTVGGALLRPRQSNFNETGRLLVREDPLSLCSARKMLSAQSPEGVGRRTLCVAEYVRHRRAEKVRGTYHRDVG